MPPLNWLVHFAVHYNGLSQFIASANTAGNCRSSRSSLFASPQLTPRKLTQRVQHGAVFVFEADRHAKRVRQFV